MKVFKINSVNIPMKSSKNILKTVPIVTTPLIAYVLRTERETVDYMGEQALKGFSSDEKMKTNINIMSELESKGIIDKEQPWNPPRFNDSCLTNNAYEGVVAKINASKNLSQYEKEQYLKKLANANYKTYHKPLSFKGDDIETLTEGDINSIGLKTDISGIDNEHILAGNELTDSFDQLIELAENPVLEGVVAEMLPGTKFLKPAKDLLEGDSEKAAIGATSRGLEILVAPVKIGWSLFGAAAGGISWLAGNRGEETGLIGGFKHASHMWAKSRNKAENYIIDREEVDPNAKQVQMRRAYEVATQREINIINTKNKEDIDNIKSKYADKDKQAEKDRLKAQKEYEQRLAITSKIRENANSRISKNNSNQEYSRQYLRQIISDKEQNLKYQKQMIDKLSMEIKSAENACNTKLTKELVKQKAQLETEFKAQKQAVLGDINEILEVSKQYETIYKKNDAEGFRSVAGYEETKKQLAAIFGVPLVQSKKNSKVHVPNIIALYGPKGTGKSLFGSSLAKQFDCVDGGSLLLKEGDDINFDRLMKMAEEAKSNYKKTGKRTIIQIDEIEYFGTKQTPSFWKYLTGKPQNFAEFLSNCADKYGCTLIVTTNNPEKIDNSIKSQMRPLYVPPANSEDMAKILEHHVNKRNKENINYKKLINLLSIKMRNGGSYSNARIENIVTTVISRHGSITQKYLEDEISVREPDISKAEIDFYKKGF